MARQPIADHEKPLPPREDTSSAPSTLPLGPWRVRVSKHTQGERKELLQLVKDRTPQPLAEFKRRVELLDGLPAAQERLIAEHLDAAYLADRNWPPAWLSAEFNAVAFATENLADTLEIALRRHNPEAASAVREYIAAIAKSDDDDEAKGTLDAQVSAILERWIFGGQVVTRKEVLGVNGQAAAEGEGQADPKGEAPPAGETTSPVTNSTPSSDITSDSPGATSST